MKCKHLFVYKKGKLDTEIQILTKKEADKSPAVYGRNELQHLPVPKLIRCNILITSFT